MIFDNNHKKEALECIESLFEKDKKVKIEAVKKLRSLSENNLYWMWIACISNETGNEKNNIHEFLCLEFLPLQQVMIFKKLIYKRLSTTMLDTKQFAEYLTKIQIFALNELNIILPNPDDLHFDEFREFYEKFI